MNKLFYKRGVILIYILYLLIIGGFNGFFLFEKIDNEFTVVAITVNDDGGADYTKIQDAIDNANSGEIIYVWKGIYYENVIVNKTVTLIGDSPTNTTIDGGKNDNVVEITANWVNISGFKMINSRISLNPTKYGAGIKINSAENVTVENNNCSNNQLGIWLYKSNTSKITNNYCSNNTNGILLRDSNFNQVINNTCKKNINGMAIVINSKFNLIENNTIILNDNFGLIIGYNSDKNIVNNNTCNLNLLEGIGIFQFSNLNLISNNTCLNNRFGILLNYSNYNTIINNTINSNFDKGIEGEYSNFNSIINNTISDNNYGINFNKSIENIIFNNTIMNSTNFGLKFDSNCANNYLYDNHILFNNNQATDTGNNFWNNSNQEGNYWSDYIGQDTGYMTYGWDITNKHLIAGDGIGDTLVPHLGLDYYPYTNQLGWLKPGTPILEDPGDVDSDGDYNLSWIKTYRTTGYVLHEDNNSAFDSPNEIFNGSQITFDISKKPNGTYYYRAKAYNEKYQSAWSNIVDIIVDWLPDIPKNLQVSTYPPGNTLNISWDLNLVDTEHYDLEFKNETMGDWEQLEPVTHPSFTYNHTGLNDGETYNYRIRARDQRGQFSNYSAIVSGIPWDSVPPKPPTGLKVISTTHNSTTLIWNPNTEDDLEGYNIFKNLKSNPSKWGEPIETIPKGNEEFIDTGLDEETTYYYVITAFDEIPNESGFSNLAQGTTALGPHGPVINNSIKDFEIPEDTIDNSINIYHWFKDINNDPLVFQCEGQAHLNVTIHQNNGTVSLIPEKNWNGKETLTFFANDSVYNISDNVTITVTPVNDAPGPAVIVEPQDGLKVENGTGINFSAMCDDVDLIYGDRLTFKWYSNISGKFGEEKNLTNILLPPGQHQIRLEVSDIAGEKSVANIKITITPTPKFDFKLEIVPDLVRIKPGEQISVTAIVTNLGEVDDMIVLKPQDQDVQGINASINGPKIKNIIPNGTAEFNITIFASKDLKKGKIQLTIMAASGNAAVHKFILEKKATLTIKIIEDKETSTTDTISENIWFYIFIVIIIIVILICIFMLIVTRKKRAKQRSLPTVEAEIEEPGAATTSEIVQQIQAASSSEQLPTTTTSDGSQPSTLSTVAKKDEPEQMSVPLAKQAPRLPPGQIDTTEESLTEDEEKPPPEDQTIPSSGSEQKSDVPNQESQTARDTSSSD